MVVAETERRTVIVGRDGVEHKYVTYILGGWRGLPLFRKIQRSVLAAVIHGADGVGFAGGSGVSLLERELKAESFLKAAEPAIDLLCGDPEFVLELFSTTARDGVGLDQGGIDLAYQGNYGEYYAAAIWLIRENFLDPLVDYLNRALGSDIKTKATELFRKLSKTVESTG